MKVSSILTGLLTASTCFLGKPSPAGAQDCPICVDGAVATAGCKVAVKWGCDRPVIWSPGSYGYSQTNLHSLPTDGDDTVHDVIDNHLAQTVVNWMDAANVAVAQRPSFEEGGTDLTFEAADLEGYENGLITNATTQVSVDQNDHIVEAEIKFNSNEEMKWFEDDPDSDEADIVSTLVHEMGHVFGLGEADPSSCPDPLDTSDAPTMLPNMPPGTTHFRSLTEADGRAVEWHYVSHGEHAVASCCGGDCECSWSELKDCFGLGGPSREFFPLASRGSVPIRMRGGVWFKWPHPEIPVDEYRVHRSIADTSNFVEVAVVDSTELKPNWFDPDTEGYEEYHYGIECAVADSVSAMSETASAPLRSLARLALKSRPRYLVENGGGLMVLENNGDVEFVVRGYEGGLAIDHDRTFNLADFGLWSDKEDEVMFACDAPNYYQAHYSGVVALATSKRGLLLITDSTAQVLEPYFHTGQPDGVHLDQSGNHIVWTTKSHGAQVYKAKLIGGTWLGLWSVGDPVLCPPDSTSLRTSGSVFVERESPQTDLLLTQITYTTDQSQYLIGIAYHEWEDTTWAYKGRIDYGDDWWYHENFMYMATMGDEVDGRVWARSWRRVWEGTKPPPGIFAVDVSSTPPCVEEWWYYGHYSSRAMDCIDDCTDGQYEYREPQTFGRLDPGRVAYAGNLEYSFQDTLAIPSHNDYHNWGFVGVFDVDESEPDTLGLEFVGACADSNGFVMLNTHPDSTGNFAPDYSILGFTTSADGRIYIGGANWGCIHETGLECGWLNIFEDPEATGVVSIPGASPGATRPPSVLASPNPFNPATKILLQGEIGPQIEVKVFDAAGRLVRILLDADSAVPESRTLTWDGRNDAGVSLASGVYFLQVKSARRSISKRLVLLK